MKIIVKIQKHDQNIMEFDGDQSDLSQEEILKNIISVAQEWLKRFEEEKK